MRLINRQFMEQFEAAAPYIKGLVIDVGCGNKPFADFISLRATKYIGFDQARSAADVICDVRHLPLDDNSVDTVLMLQVLDDVPEPLELLSEMNRVLRVGGALVISVNQTWRVHDAPNDFFRFTPYGLRHLIAKAGLTTVQVNPMGGMWAYFGNRLAFWVDDMFGSRPLLRPFARFVGVPILILSGIVDRWDFHAEDTQNNFVIAIKAK